MLASKRNKIIALVLGLVLLSIGGYYVYDNFISREGQARNFVEKYMKTVGKGGDIYDYIGLTTEGFIDVFDYKYLDALEPPKEKNIISFNFDRYERFDKDRFDTYEEYKDHYKQIYADAYEVIVDDDMHYEIWREGSYIEKYRFLYDVTIANGLGQKVYRKVEITVRESALNKWKIEDIYIR